MTSLKDLLSAEAYAALASLGSGADGEEHRRSGDPTPGTSSASRRSRATTAQPGESHRGKAAASAQGIPLRADADLRELESLTRVFETIEGLVALGPESSLTRAQADRSKAAMLDAASLLALTAATRVRAVALAERVVALSSEGLPVTKPAGVATPSSRVLEKPRPHYARVPPHRLPPGAFGPVSADYYDDPTNSK